MKRNEGKYETVTKLPKNALLVKDYAKELGFVESAIYNRYSRALEKGEDPGFKIIIYIERNFVVPH